MGRYKWSGPETVLLKHLKEMRAEAGLSGPEIQRRLQRPNSYVSKVESGEKRLDILELHEYCRACGVSMSDFVHTLEKKLSNSDKC
ncbi:MAG: helix-turn-helix transcriptional regulator [Mariprofundaceae bacterium]